MEKLISSEVLIDGVCEMECCGSGNLGERRIVRQGGTL